VADRGWRDSPSDQGLTGARRLGSMRSRIDHRF
jgi:hypothetical protein